MRTSIPSSGHPEVSLRHLVRDDAADWYACLMQPGVLEHTSWQLSSVDDLAPIFDALETPRAPTQIRMAVVDRGRDDRTVGDGQIPGVDALEQRGRRGVGEQGSGGGMAWIRHGPHARSQGMMCP